MILNESVCSQEDQPGAEQTKGDGWGQPCKGLGGLIRILNHKVTEAGHSDIQGCEELLDVVA